MTIWIMDEDDDLVDEDEDLDEDEDEDLDEDDEDSTTGIPSPTALRAPPPPSAPRSLDVRAGGARRAGRPDRRSKWTDLRAHPGCLGPV